MFFKNKVCNNFVDYLRFSTLRRDEELEMEIKEDEKIKSLSLRKTKLKLVKGCLCVEKKNKQAKNRPR